MWKHCQRGIGQKAGWRDEPLSKHCVSAQPFCSAVIASKSTGSAAAEAATVSLDLSGGGEGQKIGNTVQADTISVLYRSESNLAISSSPVKNNDVQF